MLEGVVYKYCWLLEMSSGSGMKILWKRGAEDGEEDNVLVGKVIAKSTISFAVVKEQMAVA